MFFFFFSIFFFLSYSVPPCHLHTTVCVCLGIVCVRARLCVMCRRRLRSSLLREGNIRWGVVELVWVGWWCHRSRGARGTPVEIFERRRPSGGDAGGPHRHLWDNGETYVGIPTMGRPLAIRKRTKKKKTIILYYIHIPVGIITLLYYIILYTIPCRTIPGTISKLVSRRKFGTTPAVVGGHELYTRV